MSVIKIGQVESVDDPEGGGRIRVRLVEDEDINNDDLPYAFPLLPKTIQSVPKKNEAVMVITAELGNNKSNRYYIGPVISQMQYMEKEPYNYGKGTSISMIQGGIVKPLRNIEKYKDKTFGAFPEKDDIAIIGRTTEDIILKDSEIDIRCGVRGLAFNDDEDLKGKVVFNSNNPTYIQLKMKNSGSINMVSDEVNIISHAAVSEMNGGPIVADPKDLMSDEALSVIKPQLHQVPYGDKIVAALTQLRSDLNNHTHPWADKPPHDTINSNSINYGDILSNTLRIS